jgi:hypothetical protein
MTDPINGRIKSKKEAANNSHVKVPIYVLTKSNIFRFGFNRDVHFNNEMSKSVNE